MTPRPRSAARVPGAGSGTAAGRDSGFIVLGWLTKVVLTLAVLGVVAFDLVAVALAHFRAGDRATNAARAASVSCRTTGATVQMGYDAAYRVAQEHQDTIDTADFRCTPAGDVTLTYRHTASTLLVERIGPLRRFADIRSGVTLQAPR